MLAIKELWRTYVIIIALIAILITVAVVPINENNAPAYGSPRANGVKVSQLGTPAGNECYLAAGFIYREGSKNVANDVGHQIDDFSKMVGRNQTVFFDIWADLWADGEPFWQLRNYQPLLDQGKVKAIGVTIWPCVKDNGQNDNFTVKEIAEGTHDDFITKQANEVKAFGYPVFIRFGAEFNLYQGLVNTGQDPKQAYRFGENPSDFVNAWKQYVTIFRNQNVTNAIFLWNPNWADFGPHHWTEYYPGDEYVDWVGIDLYQYYALSKPDEMIQGVYNDYSARKPIAVAEWGANWIGQHYSDTDRALFVNNFFTAVESRPQIKMVNYWYWQDFKFDPTTLPNMTAAYAAKIADPHYIG